MGFKCKMKVPIHINLNYIDSFGLHSLLK